MSMISSILSSAITSILLSILSSDIRSNLQKTLGFGGGKKLHGDVQIFTTMNAHVHTFTTKWSNGSHDITNLYSQSIQKSDTWWFTYCSIYYFHIYYFHILLPYTTSIYYFHDDFHTVWWRTLWPCPAFPSKSMDLFFDVTDVVTGTWSTARRASSMRIGSSTCCEPWRCEVRPRGFSSWKPTENMKIIGKP